MLSTIPGADHGRSFLLGIALRMTAAIDVPREAVERLE